MTKFQRNYRLVYTIPPTTTEEKAEVITIEYPLTCEFEITRNTYSQANTASFRINNLAPETRAKIFQDKYNIYRYCFVDFYAGYGDQLSLLFTGKVTEAYSKKTGTEIVTEIQAMDNDIIQSYSMHTFEAGTSKQDVIKTLASDMPNIQLGAVGANSNGVLANRLICDDLTFVAINKVTGNSAFIDVGKLNVLGNNEVLKDVEIYKITSDTGLLGTPERRDAQVEVNMIFEPKITVGQLVEIESSTASIFDGQFKVIGIKHSGVISGSQSGEARTTVNLFIGALIPNTNQIFTEVSASEPLSEVKGFDVTPVTKEVLSSIKQVRLYLIKNNTPPSQRITSGIKWSDVLLNYSKQGSVPSLEVLTNLYGVATQLQAFVDRYYPGNKITINSGWRSRTYNATIPGAAPNSAHVLGKALDFKIAGQPLYYVYQNIKKSWNGWYYQGSSWIHVNTPRGGGRVANDK